MTLVERTRELAVVPTEYACWWCHDTGYVPNGDACSCDARPFEGAATDAIEPIVILPRPAEVIDARTELEAAIDAAVAWARQILSSTVRLSQFSPYLHASGPQVPVAERVAAAALDLHAASDDLFTVADRLRSAAVDVLKHEGSRVQ